MRDNDCQQAITELNNRFKENRYPDPEPIYDHMHDNKNYKIGAFSFPDGLKAIVFHENKCMGDGFTPNPDAFIRFKLGENDTFWDDFIQQVKDAIDEGRFSGEF